MGEPILDSLLNQRCYAYGADPVCRRIAIIVLNRMGDEFDSTYYQSFLEYIFNSRHCIDHVSHTDIIKRILKIYVPYGNLVYRMASSSEKYSLLTLMENKNFFSANRQFGQHAIGNILGYIDDYYDEKLIDFFFYGYEIYSIEQIEDLTQVKNSYVFSKLSPIVFKLLNKYGEKHKKIFLDLFKNIPYSTVLIEMFVMNGYAINERCLEVACSVFNEESIKYVLQQGGLELNRRVFRMAIENVQTGQVKNKIIKFFLNLGYQPDLDDAKFLVEHRVSIPNPERYGIMLDENFFVLCMNHHYVPPYKIPESKKMGILQNLCLKKNVSDIRTFIKKNKVVPDRTCMENASSFSQNSQVVDVLVKNNGKVTFSCIKNSTKKLRCNRTLLKLLEEYEKQHMDDIIAIEAEGD